MMTGERFPWKSHRSMAQVAETERLWADWNSHRAEGDRRMPERLAWLLAKRPGAIPLTERREPDSAA